MVTSRPPTRVQLILYAAGSIGVALSYQAFATFIQFLYIDILGVRAVWIGLVWAIYGVWNAINDPLAGYWSDRTHTRWGRRIPWIAGLFIPLSITFYLLWFPFGDGRPPSSELGLLAYFFIFVIAFDTIWTLVVMNWTALFPEMAPDEAQRASVSGWRQVFSIVGLFIGVALPPILAGEDWSSRSSMALLLSVVTAVSFGVSLLGSRERPEFVVDETPPFMTAVRTTLVNADFRIFLIANLLLQYVFLALAANIPFYAKYVLEIQGPTTVGGLTLDPGLQNSALLAAAFFVALLAMPIWTAAAKRFGAWKALSGCALFAAASLLLFFLPATFLAGMAATAFFGLSFAGLLMLPDLLIADLVDADELQTGARREGMYFGMNGLIIRLAFVIQGILTAVILTTTGYVNPSEGVLYPAQPDSALFGIRLMLAGLPSMALLLAFIVLRRYRLKGETLAQVREEVDALHAEKRAALASS
jgi:GPH family glycoside/pentoside/hexuronide:cation symporter